jgi:hypothetical protein
VFLNELVVRGEPRYLVGHRASLESENSRYILLNVDVSIEKEYLGLVIIDISSRGFHEIL